MLPSFGVGGMDYSEYKRKSCYIYEVFRSIIAKPFDLPLILGYTTLIGGDFCD